MPSKGIVIAVLAAGAALLLALWSCTASVPEEPSPLSLHNERVRSFGETGRGLF